MISRILILIVSDENSATRQIAQHLEQQNWQVIAVGTGEEAISMIQEMQPIAVVIDAHLPVVSGWDVLEKVRHNPKTHSTVVFLIYSADATDEDYSRGHRLGADANLSSPLNPTEVITFITRVLKHI